MEEQPIITRHDLRKIKLLQAIRVFVFTILGVVVVAVAIDNTDDVTLQWLFDDDDVPQVVVILVSWGIGVVMGLLALWHVGARTERRITAETVDDDSTGAGGSTV